MQQSIKLYVRIFIYAKKEKNWQSQENFFVSS